MAREKVVLAYSGGLDTSVAIRWLQENHDVDVIALADRCRPGATGSRVRAPEGAHDRRGRVHRQGRARGVRRGVPRQGAAGERAVREQVPAPLGDEPADHREAPRRGGAPAPGQVHRARLHRQGQRPGALRGGHRRARPRPRGARPRARVGPQDARAGDGLRRRARHPGAHHQGEPVLDRRQPVGPRHRVRRARGPVGRAAERHLHADQRCARRRVRRAPSTPRSASSRACPVALNGETRDLPRDHQRHERTGRQARLRPHRHDREPPRSA